MIAFEDGYETWELDNIVPVHAEGSDKDLWKVWEFFKKDVVNGLVQEAKDGRTVKLIGIDTVDRAIDACTAWILNDRKRKYGKTFESIQDISEGTGGKENGWMALGEELKKPFDTLKNAGYGLFFIGWTKEKETTTYNGLKYNSVQLMMANTGRKVFESQASLICCLHDEINVYDRQGEVLESNIKDKKGNEKATNFHETKAMMYFRPSEYIEIAGGRYTDLPDKIEYSTEGFLEVFENAVKGQLKKTKATVEEIKVEEEVDRQEKLDDLVEKIEDENNDPDTIFSEIQEIISNMTQDQKVEAAKGFEEEWQVKNYAQHKGNVTELKKALDIVNKASA